MKCLTRLALCVLIVASWTFFSTAGLSHPFHDEPAPDSPKPSARELFADLDDQWPTPSKSHTASGGPGPEYWQQQVDYSIDVTLNDDDQSIHGKELVTYHNNSPHALTYLWFQLDANIFSPRSDAALTRSAPDTDEMTVKDVRRLLARKEFDGSTKIESVTDAKGDKLKYRVVKTNMKVMLPQPLAPGKTFQLNISWNYKINDCKVIWGRTGYEYFEEDKNYLYEIAQWFPRACGYTEEDGWQHEQYLGRGEFALEFGDYEVRITAPADHVVAATGQLQNPNDVLTANQRERLEKARTAKKPLFIITPDEAKANEAKKSPSTKTWHFTAKNVRDFAFASSRKFIWDAQGYAGNNGKTLAMSFYPNIAKPLWEKYSTASIIHTLNVYGKYTFEYPYPVAISVNGPVFGMEYPMICFNGPRPEKDGTYSQRTKNALISVVIHEVGHNWFPMIVNSNERQWTWLDEGLNTFLQYRAEQEWQKDYPSRSGEPERIVKYMKSDGQVPIMTRSDSVVQFGGNGYAKPAAGLNILRETILGREVFDEAFKEYAQRWKFKRPRPEDFFRTMQDASGVDLHWFWRGWFYSTQKCDIALSKVEAFSLDKIPTEKDEPKEEPKVVTRAMEGDADIIKFVESHPHLKDFYDKKSTTVLMKKQEVPKWIKKLSDDDKKILQTPLKFYVVELENKGGLVMPIILRVHFEKAGAQTIRIPAEVWRYNHKSAKHLVLTEHTVTHVELDPQHETPDVDRSNNRFPRKIDTGTIKLAPPRPKKPNTMQKLKEKEKKDKPKKDKPKKDSNKTPTDDKSKAAGPAEPTSSTPPAKKQ